MSSSRNGDLILSVFSDARSVFSLKDVAMLVDPFRQNKNAPVRFNT